MRGPFRSRRAVGVQGVLTALLVAGCAPTPPNDPGSNPRVPASSPEASGGFLLRDVSIVDGTGAAAVQGSVRVRDGRILEVGGLTPEPGERVIEGGGMTLAPGFIDTHSHHDRGILEETGALAAVSQGITTIVAGQDGGSRWPLSDFLTDVEEARTTVNVASYAGHGTLRRQVMGEDFRRAATPGEIHEMETLLRREMAAGALGLSTGLEYDPGIYATTEEVLALARTLAETGGRYISHMRSEDRAFFDALDETIRIAEEVGIPVQISHMKLAMRGLWGRVPEVIARLDAARARGAEITADVYPYEYWQSTMTVLFPDRDFTDRTAAAFALEELVAPEGMRIGDFDAAPEIEGMTLAEVARARGTDPVTTFLDLIAEADAHRQATGDGDESIVATSMDRGDIQALLAWEHTNVASDGGLRGAHPRGFGAFTRVLGRYVREDGALTLEEAVHKMTGLAAAHMGLADRGVIRPGAPADLVLFDPARVLDRATPENPHQTSTGIDAVWVGGVLVYDGDEGVTNARPGVVLRRARPAA